jgi:hypothetical protein
MKIEDVINTLDPNTLNYKWVIDAVEALKAENKAQAAEIEGLKRLLGSSLCHSHGENIVSGCEWCDAVGVALK